LALTNTTSDQDGDVNDFGQHGRLGHQFNGCQRRQFQHHENPSSHHADQVSGELSYTLFLFDSLHTLFCVSCHYHLAIFIMIAVTIFHPNKLMHWYPTT